MTEYISENLADKILSINYDNLSDKTINRTKKSIIDYLGAVIAGYSYASLISKSVLSIAKDKKKEATIIGEGGKTSIQNAALANGTLSHVVELDDGHNKALGHPGVSVITAALSASEYKSSSGKDLITAIVAGYEVFVRLGETINPSHRDRGFHTTGTCGTFAAAAAAGKLFGLSKDQLINALALSGLQSAGLMEVTEDGHMAKALHAGRSAQSGIMSVLLSEKNCRGPKSIFEGKKGFFHSYSDEVNIKYIQNQISDIYAIEECYTKLYPSCRHTHPPVDAILELKKEKEITHKKVKKIIIKTYPAAIKLTGQNFFPDTVEAAKFSMPFCVSAALKMGRLSLKEFNKQVFDNKDIKNIIKKIELKEKDELEKINPRIRGAEVDIMLTNGSRYNKRINLPKGEPENPLTDKELKKKFDLCTENIFNINKRNKILDSIYQIDDIKNLEVIFDILLK